GRLSHTTGGSMHQDTLTRADRSQVHQRVVGSQIGHGYRSRFFQGPSLGYAGQAAAVGYGCRAEGTVEHAHDTVAGNQILNLLPDLQNGACALDTHPGLPLDQAKRNNDVTEVDPG